jgi:hypothetical protein
VRLGALGVKKKKMKKKLKFLLFPEFDRVDTFTSAPAGKPPKAVPRPRQ